MKHYKPYRVWINQPSINQLDHKYHGMNGIAIPEEGEFVYIYLCEGDIVSMRIAKSSLSEEFCPKPKVT